MDIKWHKWKFQNWKSPPVLDAVLLSRPFVDSNIRYMECFESTFVLILSDNANIEIWNIKIGSVVYHLSLQNSIKYVDFCCLYQHDSENETGNIENWTVVLINKEGFLIKKQCNSSTFGIGLHNTNICLINKYFFKSIFDTKSIILINNDINIINCTSLEALCTIPNPFEKEIHCLLITSDSIIAASEQNLIFYEMSINTSSEIKWNIVKKSDSHKNNIVNLIEIDENTLASISSEAVKIWKKPDFNITRMFNTLEESGNPCEKSILCSIYNSRYLTIAFNCCFAIFDCINGSTMAKVSDAHDSKIIGLAYFNWLSMLLTVAEDGVSRLWAFQLPSNGHESIKYRSASPMSKTIVYSSYFSFISSRSMDERAFLGKSLEKCDRENQQASCYLESRYLIKSKNHFVNLEDIGMLTSDGSANLLLWRNRDYLFNGLIKLLQT